MSDAIGESVHLFQRNVRRYLALGIEAATAETWARSVIDLGLQYAEQRGELEKQPDPEWLFQAGPAGYLDAAREDGVSDEEIRDWHGRSFLERATMQAQWEFNTLLISLYLKEQGLVGEDEAEFTRVLELHSSFWQVPGDPPDEGVQARPLPAELYPRYQKWYDPLGLSIEQLGRRAAAHGTFNDYVRFALQT
ncbi:MAG: hypothetical protein AAGD14_03590 [Planctomycetota bacterium]